MGDYNHCPLDYNRSTLRAMRPPPKLSRHKATGAHFVKFKGRFTYFPKDRREAEREYRRWIANEWAREISLPDMDSSVTLVSLAELYLSHVLQTRGKALASAYRSYLGYLFDFDRKGQLLVTDVDARWLHAYSTHLLTYAGRKREGLKPRSANHALKALSRMIRWAEETEVIPRSNLPDKLRLVPVPKPQPKASAPSVVVAWLQQAQEKDPRLVPWLALNYLAVMRPSEIPRLVRDEGEWVSDGVYAVHGKTSDKTGQPRYLLISEEARSWLAVAEPHWKHWQSYSHRVRTLCKYGGPRQLRGWAASHLRRAGVSLPDVRVALGHAEQGSVIHYAEAEFSHALSGLSRISVLPVKA